MKTDSSSHLIHHPIRFELFLFVYLVCALLLQKVNIYKTNIHLIDYNLVFFTIVILSRRLAWCVLQELQSLWTSSQGSANGGLTVKRVMVVMCTLMVIAWSAVRLVQQASLFNLLFLFYPLLLYLSLFGFTVEPRLYRSRFQPPSHFLRHLSLSSKHCSHRPLSLHQGFNHTEPSPPKTTVSTALCASCHTTQPCNGSHCSRTAGGAGQGAWSNTPPDSPTQAVGRGGHNGAHHGKNLNSVPPIAGGQRTPVGDNAKPQQLPVGVEQGQRSPGDKHPATQQLQNLRYTWECSLLLPATPSEIRNEVEVILSDLIIRLKQLLFNSLLCAYYVGFIPMQFADSHLYYDRWWCVEHAFLVWATSFVILCSHLLPPSYCQLLFQCTLHLGCWTRCLHDDSAHLWSPDKIWPFDAVVQWNSESFRGEGLQNVAIPCDSSQEFFYILFNSRLHVHTWLLAMQAIIVAFQIVILLRSEYWHQTLSLSVFLLYSYFILYRLLYNRLLSRRLFTLT